MHVLQPKHTKLKPEEVRLLLETLNISVSQFPKVKSTDPALPEACLRGDIIKIERENPAGQKIAYYRVVS